MRYAFSGFEAGTNLFQLSRGGRRIELAPKPLRLLLHLLSRAPEPVSVPELMAVLWPGETVTPNSLAQAVRQTRAALGEGGPAIIQTVRGRGYRIGVAVERHPESGTLERWASGDAFVGRASLLEALRRDVEAALAGSIRTILLAGEPGIGKTRTIEALCASESLEGAEVVWGRSLEGPGAPPLHPWLEIIRQLVRARTADVVRELLGPNLGVVASVSEELRALRIDDVPSLPLEADQQRFRLLESCAGFLTQLGRERPLVLVLDDLHHADALSLALWERIAQRPESSRLLLIGSYRHVAAPPNPALDRAVAATAASPNAGSALTLTGLDASAVSELLEAVGGESPPEAFVASVHERTGGNPLFVRALARGADPNADDAPAPASVIVLVRERLSLLGPESRRVLEAAAAIGRAFEVDVLAGASQITRASCLAALDDAFRGGLVTSDRDGLTWRFVHMLVGEAIYSGLSPGRRASLHVSIARALQLHFGDAPIAVAGVVAEHYRRGLAAEDPDRVLKAALAAAEVAERSSCFEEAVQHRETALLALDRMVPPEPRTRFRNLVQLSRNLSFLGRHAARIDAGRRALEVARDLGATEVARAAIAIYDIKQWGMAREPEVNEILEEALTGLPDAASPERAHLLALKAHVSVYPRLDQARELVRQAVEMARRYGGPVLRETLYVQHYVVGGPDFLALREEIAQELLASLSGETASESIVIALIGAASDRIAQGDLPGAESWYQAAVAASGVPPFPTLQWVLGNFRVGLAHMRGDYDEGERLSLETFEIGERIGQTQAPASRAAHMMAVSAARGDPGYAADLVDVVISTREVDNFEFGACAGADFSARAGRLERAGEIVESLSGDGFRDIPRDLLWTGAMVRLAHATAMLGNRKWAADVEALLESVDSLHGVTPGPILYRGSVAGARARLLEVLDRREEAASAYRRAIPRERALGATPWADENERRLAALEGEAGE